MSRAAAICLVAGTWATAAVGAEFTVGPAPGISTSMAAGTLEIRAPGGTTWTSSLIPGEPYTVRARTDASGLVLVVGAVAGSDVSVERAGPVLKVRVGGAVPQVAAATETAPAAAAAAQPAPATSTAPRTTPAPPTSTAPAPATVAAAAPVPAPAASAAHAAGATAPSDAASPLGSLLPAAATVLKDYKNYLVDMSVPVTPAFSILGVTPKTIIEPTSGRDFAVSLAQNLSNSTALGDGIGFDIAPYMLAYGKQLQLADYQQSRLLQTLGRTQLSFAGARTRTATDTVSRAGIGLSVPLMDESDARLPGSPLGKCYRQALEAMKPRARAIEDEQFTATKTAMTAMLQSLADDLSSRVDACRQDYKKNFWNASQWSAGWAQAYTNKAGATHGGAGTIWTTYAMRLGTAPQDVHGAPKGPQGQLLLHLRRTNKEQVADASLASGFNSRDSTLVAVGLKLGSTDLAFSAQASATRGTYATGEHERGRQVAVGGEYRLGKDLWIVLTVGGKGGFTREKNTPFVLGSLKFGAETEPSNAFGAGPAK